MTQLPPLSPLHSTLHPPTTPTTPILPPKATHLLYCARTILHNLQYQHLWTSLRIHTHSPSTNQPLSRPLISGLPPKRIYVHPEEQKALLKAGISNVEPELEWVLPAGIEEGMSIQGFVGVFDGIGVLPEEDGEGENEEEKKEVGWEWRGKHRQKRILLAVLHEDSTVVYYIMHDGIVKPRQN